MKKIIRRFFVLGALLGFSQVANAQVCPEQKIVIPKIVWKTKPVTILSDYTVRQIQVLSRDEQVDPNDPSFRAVLGLYNSSKSIRLIPKMYRKTSGSGKFICQGLEDVTVEVIYDPKIYISLEAMQFTCTKAQVYEHELKHHDYEVTALNMLPDFMKNHAYKTIMKFASLPVDPDEFIKARNALTEESYNLILNFLRAHTEPLNRALDSEENYTNERKLCSDEENKLLRELIRNGQNSAGITVTPKLPNMPYYKNIPKQIGKQQYSPAQPELKLQPELKEHIHKEIYSPRKPLESSPETPTKIYSPTTPTAIYPPATPEESYSPVTPSESHPPSTPFGAFR